ncbi:MAG: chalcone isomerase family protein [Pseudomonadales bacterium]|nr:chalcone isomerase family protein [Pseudomonadales bacterium]
MLLSLLASPGWSSPDQPPEFLARYMEQAKLVGEGLYRRAFWKVYSARLYAEQGRYEAGETFALQLQYERDLLGRLIAEKSIELIAAQGSFEQARLEEWQQLLENLIPDVSKGDQLTGIRLHGVSRFYLNGEALGEIADPLLNHYFFNIWLGEDTIAPKLRVELLGCSR